jgi:hypothetical protein
LALTTNSYTSVVFINEIHYDNAGTDVGEGLKLQELELGWSIIPYNGMVQVPLTSNWYIIRNNPNQSNGFGTVFVQ